MDARQIADELNRAELLAPDAPARFCPADYDDKYALYFTYRAGASLLVVVDGSGCSFDTNGALTGITPTTVQQQLANVLGHDTL
jgi:hypothetical protein